MKFLIAIDGSKASERALEKGLSLAAPTQSLVVLLTVVEPLSSYIPEVMMPTGDWVGLRGFPDIELEKKILAAGQVILQKAEETCTAANTPCKTRLEMGLPRDTICQVVKDEAPDFLVVGSRGLGSVERLMLGSVSDYVIHHCSCAAIVVR
ncbi:universal stress protein [Tumidithrix elongata RA019]|uniref:Universal stress protein n=1 Tax=Tumidithrix elongata BACA0141 TaxID=2716417 RepID=A0AAW9PYX6_9CYAN|nr:universal stress protein [Tumidithrix elongata RA019]